MYYHSLSYNTMLCYGMSCHSIPQCAIKYPNISYYIIVCHSDPKISYQLYYSISYPNISYHIIYIIS